MGSINIKSISWSNRTLKKVNLREKQAPYSNLGVAQRLNTKHIDFWAKNAKKMVPSYIAPLDCK